MYNSFGLFFSGAIQARWWRLECLIFFLPVGGLKQWFCKNITVKEGLIAKSVTEKNNSRVDCAEAAKKTVQAMRNEW